MNPERDCPARENRYNRSREDREMQPETKKGERDMEPLGTILPNARSEALWDKHYAKQVRKHKPISV